MSFRTLTLIPVLLVVLVAYASGPRPVVERVFLRQQAEVETGNRAWVRGPAGEIGRNQMLPSTWRAYTDASPRLAVTDPRFAERIELEHLRWLRRQFPSSL